MVKQKNLLEIIPMQETNRIVQYDILRGVAISLMLMANSAASILTVTPPFLLRLVGSFAAPVFMLLAGMMLVLTKKPKPVRGLVIVGVGCLIDLAVWQVLPFATFDVLYTIGISIFLIAYPAHSFSTRWLWIAGVALLCVGQVFQYWIGYNSDILDVSLLDKEKFPTTTILLSSIPHQFLVDGWFPIFPWIGFVCIGAAFQRSLQASYGNTKSPVIREFKISNKWGLGSAILLIFASVYWSIIYAFPLPRSGYIELFYPPDLGYCLTALGVFGTLLFLIQFFSKSHVATIVLAPFDWMGQRSLWIYVLHLAVIRFGLKPFFTTPELDVFLWIVLGFIVITAIVARRFPAFPCSN